MKQKTFIMFVIYYILDYNRVMKLGAKLVNSPGSCCGLTFA